MTLSYQARKRLKRIVGRHADEAEERIRQEGHGDALATIASNAIVDGLGEDDQLKELVAIAHSAEQLANDRGTPSEDEIADHIEEAWFSAEDAISKRAEELQEEIVDDVLEREVIRA